MSNKNKVLYNNYFNDTDYNNLSIEELQKRLDQIRINKQIKIANENGFKRLFEELRTNNKKGTNIITSTGGMTSNIVYKDSKGKNKITLELQSNVGPIENTEIGRVAKHFADLDQKNDGKITMTLKTNNIFKEDDFDQITKLLKSEKLSGVNDNDLTRIKTKIFDMLETSVNKTIENSNTWLKDESLLKDLLI